MSQLVNYNSGVNSFFDDFFNNTLTNFVGSDFAASQPAINVSESADQFQIELAAPGLEKEDFDLNFEKDQLTITVKKDVEKEENGEKFTRREFSYTSFSRSFNLPDEVDKNAITANYEHGILGITLPKKEEAKELPPRKIAIN